MESNKPTISVIVPVYNTEKYLDDCIQSILNQSFTNFELLLIDDGSTDRSGVICDAYASQDERVRVFHQANKGSSIARKKGLSHCVSEYVTFVDSDDVIHPDMYKLLMTSLLENKDADIIVCGVADIYGNSIRYRRTKRIHITYEKVERIDGVLRILDDTEWQSYMMNKIYRRSLFDSIVFPEGRNLDEDTSIMHLLFHQASMSLYNDSELYYYRHRENSICLSFSVQSMIKKAFDRIAARWERLQFVESHPEYHEMLNKCRNNYLAVGLAVMRIVAKYPSQFPTGFFTQNRKNIQHVVPDFYMGEYFNYRKRVELYVLKHLPFFFKFVYHFLPAW